MDEVDKKIIDALDKLYLEGIMVERATVTYTVKNGTFRFSFSRRITEKKGGLTK
jgi:hypothetical protein